MSNAGRDVHLGGTTRGAKDRGVARGDHAVAAAPEHKCRNIAQRGDLLAQRKAQLLAAGDREQREPAPARGLIGPDDRAHRPRRRRVVTVAPHESLDEGFVVAPLAPQKEVPQIAAASAPLGAKKRASEEWKAEELVGPDERSADRSRREKDESRDEGRTAHRDVKRDTAAERVAEDDGAIDADLVHRREHEVGQLREARALLAQRRRKTETGKLDDVRRIAVTAQLVDLRGERELRVGHPRKDDRVRSTRGAAGADADPVATVFDDGFLHRSNDAMDVPQDDSQTGEVDRRPHVVHVYNRSQKEERPGGAGAFPVAGAAWLWMRRRSGR